MNKKISFLGIPIIVVAFVFAIVVAVSLPWILLYGGYLLQDVQKPSIEYGEFPYKVVYEYDGEQYTKENTLIIEYKGIGIDENEGKHNKWERYLLKQQQENTYYDAEKVHLQSWVEEGKTFSIYCFLGSSEYYMGLPESTDDLQLMAGDFYLRFWDGEKEVLSVLTAEELYENHGIKIIEKSISPPITEQSGD